MDVLPRFTGQLFDQFRQMPLIQRVFSIGLIFVVCAGFGGLILVNQKQAFQPVSFGKTFTTEELTSAEKALKAAGLRQFRRDGHQLLAPVSELDRYNGVLLETDALPADLGAQMLKQLESQSPFTTDRQRSQMKEALMLQELRRMIKAVPDIEDARVAIASPERKQSWNRKSRATANVMLKPREGRDVSPSLVNSLRQVVASMVPDLAPQDVTIFDVTRGQAYSGETIHESGESLLTQKIREATAYYEQRLQKALAYIPHVEILVQVEADQVKSAMARSRNLRSRPEIVQLANRPAAIQTRDTHATAFRGSTELVSDSTREPSEEDMHEAIPSAVQISVSIPREYLQKIAKQREMSGDRTLSPAEIEEEVLAKVENTAASLLPLDSNLSGVLVTLSDELPERNSTPESVVAESPLAKFCQENAGSLALTLAGLAGIWACQYVMTSVKPAGEPADQRQVEDFAPAPVAPVLESHETRITSLDRMAHLRDEIRSLVASDPAASAELIGKWLSEMPQ
ncbi:hypothetical protein [Schlesneria sp. DSM 10557]|uniref:hypothetical protein n=1 Tax=Schlesneria sp. DSM 10557 TaxID=3044399 RepID=UPI0035A0853B